MEISLMKQESAVRARLRARAPAAQRCDPVGCGAAALQQRPSVAAEQRTARESQSPSAAAIDQTGFTNRLEAGSSSSSAAALEPAASHRADRVGVDSQSPSRRIQNEAAARRGSPANPPSSHRLANGSRKLATRFSRRVRVRREDPLEADLAKACPEIAALSPPSRRAELQPSDYSSS